MLQDKVLEAQQKDVEVGKIRDKLKLGIETPFQILEDGMIVMERQIYLPENKALKEEVL